VTALSTPRYISFFIDYASRDHGSQESWSYIGEYRYLVICSEVSTFCYWLRLSRSLRDVFRAHVKCFWCLDLGDKCPICHNLDICGQNTPLSILGHCINHAKLREECRFCRLLKSAVPAGRSGSKATVIAVRSEGISEGSNLIRIEVAGDSVTDRSYILYAGANRVSPKSLCCVMLSCQHADNGIVAGFTFARNTPTLPKLRYP
jgi:hypothetical protein